MERSKGIILIVVGLAAILIVWKVGFGPTAEKPETTTPKITNEQTAANTAGQPAAVDNAAQPTAQPNPNITDYANSRTQRDRNQGYQQMDSRNNMPPETTMKISIPKNLNQADLTTLYQEYMQISMMAGGGRSNRGRSGRGGGGMMGGGFGGGYGG